MTIAIGSLVTNVTLSSTSGAAISGAPFSFGLPFAAGDLPGTNLALELVADDNSVVPVQVDVKATHDDGTARMAVLSLVVPNIPAAGGVFYKVRRKAYEAATPLTVSDFPGIDATATIVDTGTNASGPVTGTTYTASAAAKLAAGDCLQWLSGPIVSEWIVRAPLKTSGGVEHPDMCAYFAIRAYAGGQRKVDFVIENNWVRAKATPSGTSPWENVSVTDKVYRPTLKIGNATVYTRSGQAYLRTKLGTKDTYDNTATGLANDATVYTATAYFDGVAKPLSVTGSSAQTFAALRSVLNAQIGSAGSVIRDVDNLGLRFLSATIGPQSSVAMDYGTLFPALQHTNPYRPINGDEVVHYARTRWKKTYWSTSTPAIHIAYDKAYLVATKAFPKYDPALTGDPARIDSVYTTLSGDLINSNGITKAYMGDVGYAPGIGILPRPRHRQPHPQQEKSK